MCPTKSMSQMLIQPVRRHPTPCEHVCMAGMLLNPAGVAVRRRLASGSNDAVNQRVSYLYTYAQNVNKWYESPPTYTVWSWNQGTGYQLTGWWYHSSLDMTGASSTGVGTYHCGGSTERGIFGVGCSTGSGRRYKVYLSAPTPSEGRVGHLCQDNPGAFPGGECANAHVWWRPHTISRPINNCLDAVRTGQPAAGTISLASGVRVVCYAPFHKGGGWMLMTGEVQRRDVIGNVGRVEYMYAPAESTRGNSPSQWYISPSTDEKWSFDGSIGIQLTGTWWSSLGSFGCNGSGERGRYGISCSRGGGNQYKVLTVHPGGYAVGRATICQDRPRAFPGGPCRTGVEIFWRPNGGRQTY